MPAEKNEGLLLVCKRTIQRFFPQPIVQYSRLVCGSFLDAGSGTARSCSLTIAPCWKPRSNSNFRHQLRKTKGKMRLLVVINFNRRINRQHGTSSPAVPARDAQGKVLLRLEVRVQTDDCRFVP